MAPHLELIFRYRTVSVCVEQVEGVAHDLPLLLAHFFLLFLGVGRPEFWMKRRRRKYIELEEKHFHINLISAPVIFFWSNLAHSYYRQTKASPLKGRLTPQFPNIFVLLLSPAFAFRRRCYSFDIVDRGSWPSSNHGGRMKLPGWIVRNRAEKSSRRRLKIKADCLAGENVVDSRFGA